MTSHSGPQPVQQPEAGSKERFFRYFQHEITALQEQMERLQDMALAGGERSDAVDHCLAGIARLSHEVKDASSYVPAYDQRTYAEAIKALSEKLSKIRSNFAPRPKFSFKARKNPSAISLQDAAELASQQRKSISGFRPATQPSTTDSSRVASPDRPPSPRDEATADGEPEPALLATPGGVRKPSFSKAASVTISNHKSQHILLPSSAAHATSSGMLSNLRHCIVDMSVLTANGAPFAGLTVKNIRSSLLVCGHVDGPLHITNVRNSVVVVACRQFRMHDCKGLDVYLHCASRPIIEDCEDIRFAPLPEPYALESTKSMSNNWNQVDDFKWLRPEPSPNWSVLPSSDRTRDEVWTDLVPGGPELGLEDILRAVSVKTP